MAETLVASTDTGASYEALIEFLYLAPVGIIRFRPDGRIELANPAAAQLLMPLAGNAELSDLYRVLSAVLPDLRARVERFAAPAGQILDQMQLTVPGTRTVLTLGINKIDPDTMMAVIQDITRAIEQENRIRDDQQRFRAIFENVRDYAIFTVGLDGRVEDWNRSLNRLGGWEPADVTGAPVSMFFPPGQPDQARAATLLEGARQRGTAEFEGWGIRRDGSAFWGNTVATALPDGDGKVCGYVMVTRDMTERKQMEDRLVALATTDPLTGAFNRRAGEARLDEAFHAWRRTGRGFAALMVDCDHFKAINDRWGHDAGDEVLTALVRICGETVRRADVTVRWGGEEFLLLLPETGHDAAVAVAERLRRAVGAAKVARGDDTIRFAISIGVAVAGIADANRDSIIRRADAALYRAKRAGRNRVVAD
jgi:diguanylate cyclase (GGDEF)-like protein/PAS domain S-box-containing protein